MRTLALPILLLALGCGGKGRVGLSVAVTSADLQVAPGALGTFLAGTADVRLELGANAPEKTTVDLESLRLLRASDDLELVAALPLDNAPAPTEIGPGQTRTWNLVLDATDPIAAGLQDEICAEPVTIRGSVTDTASGGPTSFTGAEITPEGCP
jgi:hypothetical protein